MELTVVSGTLQDGIVDFTQSDGSVWRRTGSCARCGQCCIGQPDGAWCPFLRSDGAVFSCSDRTAANATYAGGCVVWPNTPVQIAAYPSCSYRFERP